MASKVYKALADPTRRKILQLLRERDRTAGEIAEHFPYAKPTLSRHFAVLREADLIQGDKRANTIVYRLNVSVLEEALWLMLETFGVQAKETTTSRPKAAGENDAQSLDQTTAL
jgi:DNA-binding transcriptional ArsR family regulator